MNAVLPLLLASALLGMTPASAQSSPQLDDMAMRDVLSRAAESLAERQDPSRELTAGSQPQTEIQSSYGQSSYDQTSYSQPASAAPAPGVAQNSVAAASQFNPAAAAAQSAATASAPVQPSSGDMAGGRSLLANAVEYERPAVPLRGALPTTGEAETPRVPVTRVAASAVPLRRDVHARLRTPRIPFLQAETSHLAPEAAIAAARTRAPAPPFEELN